MKHTISTFSHAPYTTEQIEQFTALYPDDVDVVLAYWNQNDSHAMPNDIMENYRGEYRDGAEFLEELLEETGELKNIPLPLRNYIDFEEAWKREYCFDFIELENINNGNTFFFWAY